MILDPGRLSEEDLKKFEIDKNGEYNGKNPKRMKEFVNEQFKY